MSAKGKRASTFLIKEDTVTLLTEIVKDVNSQLNIKVSKSEIVDILIQDARKRDLTRLVLTW